MKNSSHTLAVALRLLQVCAVLAIAAAATLVVLLAPGIRAGTVHLPALLVKAALWLAAWVFFLDLLGRIRREPTAWTQQNAASLLRIGLCMGSLGAVQLVQGAYRAIMSVGGAAVSLGQGLRLTLYTGLLPLMLFGVAAVALVLRGLLLNAIDLQQEADLTI